MVSLVCLFYKMAKVGSADLEVIATEIEKCLVDTMQEVGNGKVSNKGKGPKGSFIKFEYGFVAKLDWWARVGGVLNGTEKAAAGKLEGWTRLGDGSSVDKNVGCASAW